jgi:hypothetical protein
MSQQNPEYLDVVNLLVKNFREDKPLLEGAVLFHGSRFGDQTPGKDTPEVLHANLLPQIAAGHTHNWQKGDAFIDAYAIDRENTKFFANHNLDNHLKGEKATAYSVQDVERGIRPLVENLAYLPSTSKAWEQTAENLEKYIKSSFYEAGVPLQRDGAQTQPQDKFFYTGGPSATSTKEVLSNMEQVTPVNEARAKEAFAVGRSSDVAKTIDRIEATHPEASKAFQVLRGAVQRDQANNVLSKHGEKPLLEFVSAARNEPSSEMQGRVLRLAQGLANSLDSQDINVRARALSVTGQLGKLDPSTATLKDVAQEISKVNQNSQNSSRTESREQAAANIFTQKSGGASAAVSQDRGFAR